MRICEIDGFPGYFVSDTGLVVSTRRGRRTVLKPMRAVKGYLRVRLYAGGSPTLIHIHRLVACAFCERSAGDVVRHLDGSKDNNVYTNLAWGTHRENSQDAIRHGTFCNGQRHALSKLTEAQVIEIKERLRHGERRTVLAKEFKVLRQTIHKIAHNQLWKHLEYQDGNGTEAE